MTEETEDGVNAWNDPRTEEVSTFTMDAAVKTMQATRENYEALKKVASDAHARVEEAEMKLLGLLKKSGKSKYHVDGLGTVSIRNKYIVRTPKGLTEKQAFFEWVGKKYDQNTLLGILSVNHQTLNSFVNSEKEKDPQVDIPGLEAPVHEEILAFRSGK